MKGPNPEESPTGAGDEFTDTFEAALDGNARAAARIYDHCLPLLSGWLGKRFAIEIAHEAAHDALVSAFANGSRFQSGRKLLPWLFSIGLRTAIDYVRSETRRRAREQVHVAMDSAGSHGDSLPFRYKAVLQSIASLPASKRSLVERRYLNGESSDAIAKAQGRSRVSVAVELHRVCRSLRAAVESAE